MNKALLASLAVFAFPAASVLADSLIIDTTEPTGSNVIVSIPHTTHSGTPTANPDLGPLGERDTFTTVFPVSAGTGIGDRGQTFLVPTNPTGPTWTLNSLTVRADAQPGGGGVSQDFSANGPNSFKLWVFEWNPNTDANNNTQWILGDGIGSDNDPFDGTGITNFLVNGATFDATHAFSGEYLHFDLSTTAPTLNNNTAYGMLLAFEQVAAGFKLDDVRDGQAPNGQYYANGAILRADNTTQALNSNGDDIVFYVNATPSPEPTSAALFGVGACALLTQRRHRRG
jgi:hypothetical protein